MTSYPKELWFNIPARRGVVGTTLELKPTCVKVAS
jgi:hypothetical protein